MASDRIIEVGDRFWNIRGSFKIGFLDIRTQASLVRLSSGGFALLDAYTLQGDVEREVRQLTDGGAAIKAVINLHPFHTVHVKRVAEQLPDATFYGTARHVEKAPEVRWAFPAEGSSRTLRNGLSSPVTVPVTVALGAS